MAQNFIPDNSFIPDAEPQTQALSTTNFVPDSQFVSDEDKYGAPVEQLKAGAEAVARGATLGASDVAEQSLGISTKEKIAQRREQNPVTSFLGETAGSIAPIALTEGAAAPLALGKVASGALVGGVLGAGNLVSDLSLGEPNLTAQKILTDVGGGIAGGAAFGVLEKGLAAIPALWRGAIKEVPGNTAAEAVSNASTSSIPGEAILQANEQPSSIGQLQEQIKNLKKYSGQENIQELPQAAAAKDAASRMNSILGLPFDDMQLGSLASQDARNSYKTDMMIPGDSGQALRDREIIQKKNLSNILDNTIDNISPGYTPTTDAAEAGSKVAEYATDSLETKRKAFGEAIGTLKGTQIENVDHLPGVVDALTESNPKIANMFDTTGEDISFKPWDPQMGITEKTYSNVKKSIESIQKQNPNLEGLFDIRKHIEDGVNLLEKGDASNELSRAKSAMMDYIQNVIQSSTTDASVRDTFANYAKTLNAIDTVESKFGAKVGTGWKSAAEGKPEESILGKIFKDSAATQAAKEIFTPEQFKNMLADYVAIQKNAATREGTLSSAKFSNFLNGEGHKYSLNEAFSANPEVYQKLKDATTLLRVFPDSMPRNPSQTVPSLLEALAKGGLDPLAHAKELLQLGKSKFQEAVQTRALNEKMAGVATHNTQLKTLQNMANRVGAQISTAAKSLWSERAAKGAVVLGTEKLSDSLFNDHVDNIRNLSSNPQAIANHLSQSTTNLSQIAPNIAQGIQYTMARGIQFLASKLPPAKSPLLMSEDYTFSPAEKQRFNEYYNAVNNPVSALGMIKKSQLTPEAMEAIQAVHPQMLDEMRKQVMLNYSPEKAKSLTFSQKSALSQFMGQSMSDNLTPQVAAQNQIVFSQPNLSQQSAVKPTRATLGGMKKLNASGRSETESRKEGND